LKERKKERKKEEKKKRKEKRRKKRKEKRKEKEQASRKKEDRQKLLDDHDRINDIGGSRRVGGGGVGGRGDVEAG